MSRNEKSSLNYFGNKMMKEESLNRLLGKQCKIVTKEPCDEKNHIVIGVIKEIEYNEKNSEYGLTEDLSIPDIEFRGKGKHTDYQERDCRESSEVSFCFVIRFQFF